MDMGESGKRNNGADRASLAEVRLCDNPRITKDGIGAMERSVINEGAKLARILRNGILPAEVVVTPDSKTMRFGKKLETEKDVSGTVLANKLAEIVEQGVIRYIAVSCGSSFPQAFIWYGRQDAPEFFTVIPVGVGKRRQE